MKPCESRMGQHYDATDMWRHLVSGSDASLRKLVHDRSLFPARALATRDAGWLASVAAAAGWEPAGSDEAEIERALFISEWAMRAGAELARRRHLRKQASRQRPGGLRARSRARREAAAAGYCRHGVYVGGCGADWMCGQCEQGPHWLSSPFSKSERVHLDRIAEAEQAEFEYQRDREYEAEQAALIAQAERDYRRQVLDEGPEYEAHERPEFPIYVGWDGCEHGEY